MTATSRGRICERELREPVARVPVAHADADGSPSSWTQTHNRIPPAAWLFMKAGHATTSVMTPPTFIGG